MPGFNTLGLDTWYCSLSSSPLLPLPPPPVSEDEGSDRQFDREESNRVGGGPIYSGVLLICALVVAMVSVRQGEAMWCREEIKVMDALSCSAQRDCMLVLWIRY